MQVDIRWLPSESARQLKLFLPVAATRFRMAREVKTTQPFKGEGVDSGRRQAGSCPLEFGRPAGL